MNSLCRGSSSCGRGRVCVPQERDGRRRHHQEPNLMESTTEASSSAIRQESTAVKWTRRAFRRKEKEKKMRNVRYVSCRAVRRHFNNIFKTGGADFGLHYGSGFSSNPLNLWVYHYSAQFPSQLLLFFWRFPPLTILRAQEMVKDMCGVPVQCSCG